MMPLGHCLALTLGALKRNRLQTVLRDRACQRQREEEGNGDRPCDRPAEFP